MSQRAEETRPGWLVLRVSIMSQREAGESAQLGGADEPGGDRRH